MSVSVYCCVYWLQDLVNLFSVYVDLCVLDCRTYVKASRVLAQYQHMPSFSGIQSDCQSIVARLKSDLKNRLDDPNVSTCIYSYHWA